jgi:hypothetical protein
MGRTRPPSPGVAAVQHHVLPGLDLAAVEEADGPGDQQAVALADGAVEERLAGPGALDEPRVIPDHGLEDPEPLPRGQDPLAHHLADDRGVHPDLQEAMDATVLASS